MTDALELTGKVVGQLYGAGSKSEREAVMLHSDQGDFVLRHRGGNAFDDNALRALIGRTIRCRGMIHGGAFIMSDFQDLTGTSDDAAAR